jgi:hypothetical protein
MRVLYLTINPSRISTTMPTEGWFRVLPQRGLQPVLATTESGSFLDWAREVGIPAFKVAMPVPTQFE